MISALVCRGFLKPGTTRELKAIIRAALRGQHDEAMTRSSASSALAAFMMSGNIGVQGARLARLEDQGTVPYARAG